MKGAKDGLEIRVWMTGWLRGNLEPSWSWCLLLWLAWIQWHTYRGICQFLAAIHLEFYFDLPSKYKTHFPQSGASRHKTLGTCSAMGLPLFCLSKSTFWMNNRAPLHCQPPLSNYISTTTSVLSIRKGIDQFINFSKWAFCRTERLPRD